MLGIALMLVATLSYNVSIILLALAARAEPNDRGRTSLTAKVVVRATGSWAIGLGILGWLFELAALTQISVTLARVIYAAGFGIMLVLARWRLGEELEGREAIGIVAIGLGIIAVGTTSPSVSKAAPSLLGWIILTLVIVPTIFFPDVLRRVTKSPAAYLSGIGAGLGYAASSLYTKGVSDLLSFSKLLPLILLIVAAGVTSLVAFSDEVRALQTGRATTIVPLVAGLQSVIPITAASIFFGESWPAAIEGRFFLGGGITLTTFGMILLAYSSAQIVNVSAGGDGLLVDRELKE